MPGRNRLERLPIHHAGRQRSQPVRNQLAEEHYPRPGILIARPPAHVEPQVDFIVSSRERWHAEDSQVVKSEAHQADVGPALPMVDDQSRREQRIQNRVFNRPRKQQGVNPVCSQGGRNDSPSTGSGRAEWDQDSSWARRCSSRLCCREMVKSPRVRSRTPRMASVLRRRPPVMASGKSTVTSIP